MVGVVEAGDRGGVGEEVVGETGVEVVCGEVVERMVVAVIVMGAVPVSLLAACA